MTKKKSQGLININLSTVDLQNLLKTGKCICHSTSTQISLLNPYNTRLTIYKEFMELIVDKIVGACS
jgi:hypothetical protein